MNCITEYALKDLIFDDMDNSKYYIEKSKDDKNVIKVEKDNKSYYIGSKYSVGRDVDNFMVQMGDYNINTVFVVFGLSAGEHIVNLLKIISDHNKVLIIEPDLKIIKTFIDNIEESINFLNDKRIVLTSCDEKTFRNVISAFIEDFNVNNIKFMKFANYDKMFINEYALCYRVINDYVKANFINIATNKSFSQRFFKCFVKNIKYIIKSTLINDLKDSFKGVPAVIVSAGPSLEKNIEQLQTVQNKLLILSGGRTISSLNKVNISPHAVAVIDPGEPSYNVISNSLNCKAPLLFCEVTNYKIVNEYAGKKIFVQEGANLNNVTKRIIGKKVDSIFQGGSVAHTCTAFAQYMGCNPIIFIGQDFAFTNNKLHAEIASIEECNENQEDTILVEDIYGDKVKTSELFNVYRKHMEQFIDKSPDTTFINSTEGGADIKGTIVMDLKKAIEEYAVKDIDFQTFNNLDSYKNGININFVISNLQQVLSDMKNIKEECFKSLNDLKCIQEYYENKNNKDINFLLKKIKELNDNIGKVDFINNLLQPLFFNILMNPDYIEKVNESENEKGIRFAKQSTNLYSEIAAFIEEAIPYIKECISELKEMEA